VWLKASHHLLIPTSSPLCATPRAPIGPAWLQEAARDMTSLGSVTVLAITTFAVVTYVFLSGRPRVAWLMLIAVLGGLALNNLLKFIFARPRPKFVTATRVFTTSFPQRACHIIRDHLSHDRRSAGASLPVIPSELLFQVDGSVSNGPDRCEPCIPWCSLPD
jgi:membrane-associated phospholipid phosphatase